MHASVSKRVSDHPGSFGKIGPSSLILLGAVVIAILSFLVHEIFDYDIWWHITIGSDIIKSGSIAGNDKYSAAASGRPYHNSHWLFQVIAAFFHGFAGMVGVQIIMMATWILILFVCFLSIRRWVTFAASLLLIFLVAMASVERFLPRPELVTFLGITSFYWLLQEGRYRLPAGLPIFGLLQVLWANCHGLFVIGPFMVGCYWLFAFVEHIKNRDSELKPLTFLLATVLVATVLTPYGLGNWRYAEILLREIGPRGPEVMQSIGELSPTFGSASRSGLAFWFFFALLLISAALELILVFYRRRMSPRTLIVTGLVFAALTGRRNIVLFALAAAPFLAESLSRLIPENWRPRPWLVLTATGLILPFSWFPLSGHYYLMLKQPIRAGFGVAPSFFPHGLPAFLRGNRFRGQILNSNILGGAYLYHFFPDAVPLTDGRWETYDHKTLEFIRSATGPGGDWRHLVERYKIKGILIAHASVEAEAMVPSLARARDWRLVYLDSAASFWMPEGSSSLPPKIDLFLKENIPSVARVDDAIILSSFLFWTGAKEALAFHLERSLRFNYRLEWFLERLGGVQIELAQWEEAKKNFDRLYRLDRTNTAALNELAFLAYNRGDLAEALRLTRMALAIKPENKDFQINYRRLNNAALKQGVNPEREGLSIPDK